MRLVSKDPFGLTQIVRSRHASLDPAVIFVVASGLALGAVQLAQLSRRRLT